MEPNRHWEVVEAEYMELREAPEYKRFGSFLDTVESLIGAGRNTPDSETLLPCATEILKGIRHIQQKTSQGDDVMAAVDEVTGGFVQPNVEVNGTLNQASRDIINSFVINLFDSRRGELESSSPSPAILVPVILVVMTDTEAIDLCSGTAFDVFGQPEPLRGDFQPLVQLICDNGLTDWADRYRGTPEEWQPYNAQPGETIADLIASALELIYQNGTYDRPLRADFKDIRLLNADNNRPMLKALRERGCVVIIDCISIRHSRPLSAYHQSMLDAYPTTSIVRIAPLASAFNLVRNMKIALEWSLSDMEFDRRRLDPHDEYTCVDMSETTEFPKWFISQVKKILPTTTTSPTGILREMKI
ncbi:MAG: hypothetical protein IPG72_06335 [Ardenticatenales bacterium]|nr:hypothetical protein [Ardenticatenales bacterium]